jgi:hypothetical protein
MTPFLYRCPVTGLNIQAISADEAPAGHAEIYEPVTCVVCTRVHLISRSTGRMLGQDQD